MRSWARLGSPRRVLGMGSLATGFAFLPTAVLMFVMIRLIPGCWLVSDPSR
ncbi:hypothetical protein [Nocardia sp. NPDC060249]|uniref:hypothetical protein n=1 Tax=Nocardia sp. NPDC060249 TaxID=3347082 RepID=UPI00364A70D5